MAKYFEPSYIYEKKAALGYPAENTKGLLVMNNPITFGRYFIFGIFSMLSLKSYHLSFEEEGLLFIQRSAMNNELLDTSYFFIPNDEISEIKNKKGLIQNKLILKDRNGKKQVFKYNKFIRNVPWQKEAALWVTEFYGK